jgi:hypothetical protein
MSVKYALKDDQWERLKGFLPRKTRVSQGNENNRLFIEDVI